MSKVYEALQHAYVEQHRAVQIEEDIAPDLHELELPISRGLPQLQMEREMKRLCQNVCARVPAGMIQFIGSRRHEGTSTIVREFGLFLTARLNKSVLLVDADRGHMSQHQALGVYPKIALHRTMSEGGSVNEAISKINTSRVSICRLYEESGGASWPDYPAANRETWNALRKDFDFILIDSAPLVRSDDALALCSSPDGVILVVEAERTRSRVVTDLKHRVAQGGGNILGLVFNKQRYYIPEWMYKRL